MADLDEQRRKVEELKKKILEQRTKGTAEPVTQEVRPKIPDVVVAPSPETAKSHVEATPPATERKVPAQPVEEKKNESRESVQTQLRAAAMVGLQAYAQVLKQVWSDGIVSDDEQAILRILRQTLGISKEEHESLERELQVEVYIHILTIAWQDGGISTEESERLEFLRGKFHISSDDHFRLEKQVREGLTRTK
jgi:hypothetical protein